MKMSREFCKGLIIKAAIWHGSTLLGLPKEVLENTLKDETANLFLKLRITGAELAELVQRMQFHLDVVIPDWAVARINSSGDLFDAFADAMLTETAAVVMQEEEASIALLDPSMLPAVMGDFKVEKRSGSFQVRRAHGLD